MGGRPVLNEDLVNLPNWLVLKLRIEGDDAIGLDNVELLDYRHEYDIRYALLSPDSCASATAPDARRSLRSRRFVSMAHHHQAAIEWTITPENWSGRVEVVSAIDGRVTNRGVARYAAARGPPPRPGLAAHVRARGDRAEGPDPPVEPLRRRRPRARASSRGDEPVEVRAHAVPDGGLHPAGPRLRRRARASPSRVEKHGRVLHLARPGDHRAARRGR